MSETKSRSILAIAAATLATGVLAYVVYFDYKRRNDAQFRRKLRKEKKRVDKTAAQERETSSSTGGAVPSGNVTPEMLRAALDQVKLEEPPSNTEEKEAYFMTQVGMGEQLAAQGSAFYLPAAIAFYKALRVYPSPVELIVIYQKTVPEPLFKLIIDLTNMDVSAPSSPKVKPKVEAVEEEGSVDGEGASSPTGSGPPSETSSHEWDKLTDPDTAS
ncbi:Mitochondrial import receptor subunit tom20 [Leucoagaricus sp. SymC.cos]|nr:Mitochondrial import receptor subunit tom20 [Leucoagaricus sp. SymC.cos]